MTTVPKQLRAPLPYTEAPAPSVQIMKFYARMSYEKRLMLLKAAEVISRNSIAFEDTEPEGSRETQFSAFDSKS
jgi:hypothetical protein